MFKEIFGITLILFSFFSCSLDDTPVDEFFEKNASGVIIVRHSFSGNCPVDSNGSTCVPSNSECFVTFKLTNPQNKEVISSFSVASGKNLSSVDIANGVGDITSDAVSAGVTIEQTQSSELLLKLPQVFLDEIERSSGYLTFSVSMQEKSGNDLGKYVFGFSVNSVPPSVNNACVMIDDSGNLVLCFDMPILAGTVHENDTSSLVIKYGDTTAEFSFAPFATSVVNLALTAKNSAFDSMIFYVLTGSLTPIDEDAPSFTSDGMGFYFKPGIKHSDGFTRFEVKIIDDDGLSSTSVATNSTKKLASPTVSFKPESDYVQTATSYFIQPTEANDTSALYINVENKTVDGNAILDTANIKYKVTNTQYPDFNVDTISSGNAVSVFLYPGENVVELSTVCEGYIESEKQTYTMSVNSRPLAVSGACVQQDSYNNLVLCFNLPDVSGTEHEADIRNLLIKVNSSSYTWVFAENMGTLTANAASYSGMLSNTAPTGLKGLDTDEITFVASTRAYYFSSNIANDGGVSFTVELIDDSGLGSKVTANNISRKLKPPVIEIADGSTLKQNKLDGTCHISIKSIQETVDGTNIGEDLVINYSVKDKFDNEIESNSATGASCEVVLHPGENNVYVSSWCDGYFSSETETYTYVVEGKTLFVDATSVKTLEFGSKDYPFKSLESAIDAITDSDDTGNAIYVLSNVSINNSVNLPSGLIEGVDSSGNFTSRNITVSSNNKVLTSSKDTVLSYFAISDNSTSRMVSGIDVPSGTKLTMKNCSMENFKNGTSANVLNSAGALNVKGSIVLESVDFTDCSGGNSGGAIYFANEQDSYLKDCSFDNCKVGSVNGGGAIAIDTSKKVSIENCWFMGCSSAKNGGSIFIRAGDLTLESSNIETSTADESGGVIYFAGDASVTIKNTNIIDCELSSTATGLGGIVASAPGVFSRLMITGDSIVSNTTASTSDCNIVIGEGQELILAGNTCIGDFYRPHNLNKVKVQLQGLDSFIYVRENLSYSGTVAEILLANSDYTGRGYYYPILKASDGYDLVSEDCAKFKLNDDDYFVKLNGGQGILEAKPSVSLGNISTVGFIGYDSPFIGSVVDGRVAPINNGVEDIRSCVSIIANAEDIDHGYVNLNGMDLKMTVKILQGDHVVIQESNEGKATLDIWLDGLFVGDYEIFMQVEINGIIYSATELFKLTAP